jgi:Flp pilus assembly protein TadD
MGYRSAPAALRVAVALFSCVAHRAGCAEQATPAANADAPEVHLGKGYDALKQSRYDEAVTEFRAALQLDPKLVMRARFPLAVALFELKQSAAARKEFDAVRSEAGDHPNVLYYLGRLDLLDQDFAAAIRDFSKAATNPPFPDTAYQLGFAYFKHGDLQAAEKWLKSAGVANPKDSAVPYQLALVYRKQGRENEAQKAFALSAELRRRDVEDSQLRLECAQALDHGQRDEARSVCQRLYDPNDAEKLTALGLIYGQHGDLEAALDPLRRAAALDPQAPQMQYNLAFTYYRLNRFEEARTPIADAVRRWPDIFQLNALYGAVLSKLGEDLPAYQALRRAHQLNREDTGTADLLFVTVLGLARKSLAAHQYSDSLDYFEEAVKLRPEDPEPHRGKAEVYDLTGRQAEAAAERQQVARLSPAR